MMRKRWIALGLACWIGAGMAAVAVADDRFVTGTLSWTLDDTGALSTQQWPVDSLMKMVITTPDDSSEKGGDATAKGPFADARAKPPPELQIESDWSRSMIGMVEGAKGKKVGLTMQRSVAFDRERRALRVLDQVSSAVSDDQEITIEFHTQWRPEEGKNPVTLRQVRLGQAAAPSAVLAAVNARRDAPVLMILLGGEERGWKRKLGATADGLQWSYTGKLAARQRVLFLHWVALTDDVRQTTVRKVRESLVDDTGMPVGARMGEGALKELANFPMPVAEPADGDGEPAEELPLVKQLADELRLDLEYQSDALSMAGMQVQKGTFKARGITLDSGTDSRKLELPEIAAIKGGAGTGRHALVFLRDGTVESGSLGWAEATFETEPLGTIRLEAEALDRLILRRDDGRDGRSNFAAWLATPDGEVQGLAQLPGGEARMRWIGGDLRVKWEDVESLARLPAPDFGHELRLKDGSRVRGWFGADDARLAACTAYARTVAALQRGLEGAGEGGGEARTLPPNKMFVRTTHGSLLAGTWGQDVVKVSGPAGIIEAPVSDIRQVAVKKAEGNQDLPQLEITTTAGGVVVGAAVADEVQWRHGDQTLALPWMHVIGIIQNSNPPKTP